MIAINTKNDLVYNASKDFFPNADVEQYGRGAIRRCSGLGDWSHDPAHAKLCWLSTSVAVWQGLARGPGNEDVHPVGCGYTLQERGDSFNPQFYVRAAALFRLSPSRIRRPHPVQPSDVSLKKTLLRRM